MITLRKLTQEEIRQLHEIMQSEPSARIFLKAELLLKLHKAREQKPDANPDLKQLAAYHGMCYRTALKLINDFNEHGVATLQDKRRRESGIKEPVGSMTPELMKRIKRVARKPPPQYLDLKKWTYRSLIDYLVTKHYITSISKNAIRKIIGGL